MSSLDFKPFLEPSVLCWLATISEDGTPNVSPKEVFAAENDSSILIAHIASPKSVRNIKQNPNVCLSFLEIFSQRGCKINGLATILEPSDSDFETRVGPLKKIAGERFPIRAVIAVEVLKITAILAPRYQLYADTTEQAQVTRAVATYNRVLEQYGQKLKP